MRDIATTTLSGNLTRDVDLRQLPSGADIARLRVATTTRRRTGEEWVEKTNYFTVEAFGAQARSCAQYLTKGSRVLIDAEPDWREWTDQHGNKREAVTFKARQVLFEGARPERAATSNSATQAPAADPPAPRPAAAHAPPAATLTTSAAGTATAEHLPF
jgi:single-strand DNA-binding protein